MMPAATASMHAVAPTAVLVALLACEVMQVIHGYLRVMHSNQQSQRLVVVYEACLFAHIVLMSSFACASLSVEKSLFTSIVNLPSPFVFLLWANAVLAVVVAYASIAGFEDIEGPESIDWMPDVETLLLFCCTPVVLSVLGDLRFAVIAVDAAYFLFRSAFLLVLDRKSRRTIVSPLSINEALKKLPEGILYANGDGRTIVTNDAMRHCLAELGITGEKANARNLWAALGEQAEAGRGVQVSPEFAERPGAWTILRIADDEVRIFSFEGAEFDEACRYHSAPRLETDPPQDEIARNLLGQVPETRVIAYDVTEIVRVFEEIEHTNAELEASQEELRASMETVREAAENQAMLRMRGRVHDVIGQRLSMLHRSLEDNAISDEQLDQLKPLLSGILDDLATDTRVDAADQLEATVNAFALTGVTVSVDGALPADETQAKIVADCIREAATNAVKHALARNVNARIDGASVTITNDGQQPSEPIRESTGLTNMRRTVESAGGTLEITLRPFTLHIELP